MSALGKHCVPGVALSCRDNGLLEDADCSLVHELKETKLYCWNKCKRTILIEVKIISFKNNWHPSLWSKSIIRFIIIFSVMLIITMFHEPDIYILIWCTYTCALCEWKSSPIAINVYPYRIISNLIYLHDHYIFRQLCSMYKPNMFRVFDRVTQATVISEISLSLGENLGSDISCMTHVVLWSFLASVDIIYHEQYF